MNAIEPISIPAGITITRDMLAARDLALEQAATIQSVSAETQEQAVAAQMALVGISKLAEEARKTVKAPVLDLGRAIDRAAREAVARVEQEANRISTLLGDFQQAEIARARSLEALRVKELSEMERAREEQLSQAATLDERERIHEEYGQIAAEMSAPITAQKVEGQVVKETWEFEVENPFLFANAHPQYVKEIVVHRADIKSALEMGRQFSGLKAWKVVKSGVRVATPKTIEV